MLSSVVASSAVALAGLLVAAPAPVAALATPVAGSELGHLAARHLAGVSPNHHAIARRTRKRTLAKNRKRCQQRPQPQQPTTDNSNNNNNYNSGGNTDTNNSDNSNNNNAPGTTNLVANPPSNQPQPTQPSTQPSTPPPSYTSNGKKLMLAWPNGGDPGIPNSEYFTGNANMYYTWSPSKVDNGDGGLRFCAMLWGSKQIGAFSDLVKPGYTDCVLGMNEVNQDGQSLMNTDEGASMWNQYIGPLANQGYTILGSPSTTSNPNGLEWIKDWITKISVQPTHICVHYYDISADDFKQYMTKFYNTAGIDPGGIDHGKKPLMVTEYACQNFNDINNQCSSDQVWSFVKDTTSWMDQTEWIVAYAPFGFMHDMQGVNTDNQLMNNTQSGSHPTRLGNYFLHEA